MEKVKRHYGTSFYPQDFLELGLGFDDIVRHRERGGERLDRRPHKKSLSREDKKLWISFLSRAILY